MTTDPHALASSFDPFVDPVDYDGAAPPRAVDHGAPYGRRACWLANYTDQSRWPSFSILVNSGCFF